MTTTLETGERVESAGPDVAVRTSALKSSMWCEWWLVRYDLGWWATALVFMGFVFYALYSGRIRLDERAHAVAEAEKDESQRLASLRQSLARIEEGGGKSSEPAHRDPTNPLTVGRRQGVTVAALPDTPLSIAAVGLSDLYPVVLKVSSTSKDRFLFVDEIANPSNLLSGTFDLAFVLAYVFPLLILTLCYNVLSGEQEQGTLALTAASSAPLATILVGKLIVRTAGLMAAATFGVWVVLALVCPSNFRASAFGELVMLALATALYGVFWMALALFVNSFRRDSAFNAVGLVMTWVVLLLVCPAGINAVAQVLYPAPARAEMVLAVRRAATNAERDRDATEARYREEHRGLGELGTSGSGTGGNQNRRTLEVMLAADARSDAVLGDQETRVREQRRLCDRLSFLAPPVLFNNAVTELSGNGHTRWDDFLARVDDFHKVWKNFFVERAEQERLLTTADVALFPKFAAIRSQSGLSVGSGKRVGLALAWIGLVAMVFLGWSKRRLSRPA